MLNQVFSLDFPKKFAPPEFHAILLDEPEGLWVGVV